MAVRPLPSPLAAIPSTYRARVRAELTPRSFAIVGGLGLVFSTQILFHPHLLDLWDLSDIARSWAEYLVEVELVGAALLVAVVAVEQASVRQPGARAVLLALALILPALALMTLFHWQFSGAWGSAPSVSVLSPSLRFALLGAFVFGVRALHRQSQQAESEARRLLASQRELERQADEAQLQLLQAQIEPHFLFNTLANVRRLYRQQPMAGAEAIDHLMVYLHAALPGVRRTLATLGSEFELAQAYLELFRIRMGQRLRFRLDLPPELRGHPFPPMVLLTLVENAIKHGIAPTDLGGTVTLTARRDGMALEVAVCDDGAGFGASTGGSGVGLVNIRRQLAARHGESARLTLTQQAGGGVCARVSVPWQPPTTAGVRIGHGAAALAGRP